MFILKYLSKLGISLPIPKSLTRLLLITQSGTRGAALGMRVAVFRADGAVFLVRHTYLKGWYFPGGGIERREAPKDALARELAEEAKMKLAGEPELFGFYLNAEPAVPDYITLYIVRDWLWLTDDGSQPDARSDDGEILEAGFFMPDALPDDVSPATRRHLEEISKGSVVSQYW